LAALAAFAPAAIAQAFPSKPITLMVGFAAGGATDTAARIIAKRLSENLGVSVVVDNKAGPAATSPRRRPRSRRPMGT
jgi:tripartite-type tricarboxylate transporter receptor subunit TctC